VAAAFLGLAGLPVLWLVPRSRVRRAACEQIQEGMTEGQVAALLGRPPDDWEALGRRPEEDWVTVAAWDEPRLWVGDDGLIVVRFFDGTVTDKELHERPSAEGGLLARLRRLLGW
jgi:hypothetical protein